MASPSLLHILTRRRLYVATQQRFSTKNTNGGVSAASKPVKSQVSCLITLDRKAIEKCHIIDRCTDSDRIRQLEHHWGMSEKTLEVNNPQNYIYLTSYWHALLDRENAWGLVPANLTSWTSEFWKGTIKGYKENGHPPSKDFLASKDGMYKYQFIPLSLSDRPLVRATLDETGNIIPDAYQIIKLPFYNMPILEINVHPFYVLANTEKQFTMNLRQVFSSPKLTTMYHQLSPIWALWRTRIL